MSIEVTIQCHLDTEVNGETLLVVNPAQTVDSLISAYCIEKGVRQRTDYILRNDQNEDLHHSKSVSSCGIKSGDILYLKKEGVDEDKAFGCNTWWLLAAICVFIGTVGIVVVSVIGNIDVDVPYNYGVVFDAGSTHTKSFVYKWNGSKSNGTGVVTQVNDCAVEGNGIASYALEPVKAGQSLEHCLSESIQNVPGVNQGETPLYLGATAGMRVLNESNPLLANNILDSIRDIFGRYSLSLKDKKSQVRIISGEEEGSFGWITVNYLLGNLGNFVQNSWWDLVPASPSPTVGALDMGGASLQITYQPSNNTVDIPPEHTAHLPAFGRNYTVYTASFLCYGKMEAERKLYALLVKENNYTTNITNPCGPANNYTTKHSVMIFRKPCTTGNVLNATYTFHGTSDSASCRKLVDKLVNTSTCKYPNCAFDGVYMPELYGAFVAFNSFYFVARDLNLTTGNPPEQGMFSLESYRNATKEICSKNYTEIKSIPYIPPDFWTKLCFDAHYIDIILTKGFNFTADMWENRLYFKKNIRTVDVGWSLGFMINATNSFPQTIVEPRLSIFSFGLLLALFILFLLVSIGFACHAHRVKDNKNKYKKVSQDPSGYGSI